MFYSNGIVLLQCISVQNLIITLKLNFIAVVQETNLNHEDMMC